MRILLIDRDKSFQQALAFFLKNKGLVVDTVCSGEEWAELARLYDYDVIVTDLMLADSSGEEFIKKARASGLHAPIVVLSAVTAVPRKIDCFHLGADDYVIKPCNRDELLARIQAIARRSRGYDQSLMTVGKMVVNLDTKVVTIAGKTLPLTGREYALVELLCLRRGMTVSKEQFLNHLYGGMDEPEMKIIDVFLHRIRRKIERLSGGEQYIQTVWGRGYILKEQIEK